MRGLALLTLLLLAGCAAPPDLPVQDAPAVQPPAAPVSLPWRLLDCEAMTWSVPIAAAQLAPRLPSGFQPEPAAAPLPAGADQAATLDLQAIECSAGLGTDTTILRSVQFGRIYTPVIPPAEARDGRLGAQHSYVFDAVAAPDAWRRTAIDLGLPMHDGGTLVGASAQGWSAAVAMDDVGTFTLTGRTVGNEAAAADAHLRDFSAGADGLAVWLGTATNRTTWSGVGLWQATPGSWVAQVTGSTQGAATFALEHFTIDDGRIGPLSILQNPGSPVDDLRTATAP